MKAKTVIGAVLLLFAAGSVGYLVVTELSKRDVAVTPTEAADADRGLPDDGVVVTYFCSGTRCPTCLKIEAYAREADESGFPDDVGAGRVRWRMIDYGQPENRHFVDRYNLFAKTLVVSKRRGGREVDFRGLDRIWDLVSDRPAFLAYVRAEVDACLKDGG